MPPLDDKEYVAMVDKRYAGFCVWRCAQCGHGGLRGYGEFLEHRKNCSGRKWKMSEMVKGGGLREFGYFIGGNLLGGIVGFMSAVAVRWLI